MDNRKAFHAPLHLLDTEKQTYGCRRPNPDFCAKNRMANVCAFVRKDNICLAPRTSCPKQFDKLKQQHAKGK